MRLRPFVVLGAILVSGILLASYTNCSRVSFDDRKKGPDIFRSQDVFVGNPPSKAARSLLSQVCIVITRCHSQVTTAACEAGVLQTTGIDYQLGLPRGSVSAFSEIVQAESTGTLRANEPAAQSCMSATENLNCADPVVQSAYDGASSAPYSGVAYMLPTAPGSCPAVFNQPPARSEFFVATTGSDQNDGSKERPWATITHASTALTPGAEGAIVHVAPGTYSFAPSASTPANIFGPASVYTARSGTSAAPITYISDQQWGAKIVASNAAAGWYNSGHYVKIIGFEIVGTSSTNFGIYSDGSFGQMVGNHIHNIPVTYNCSIGEAAGGIVFGYNTESHDNDSIGNLIHDIGPLPGNGLPQSSYCHFAHGLSYRQARGKIQNNIIYRVNTWAFSTWHTAGNFQITNNLFFNNGAAGSNGLVGGAISLAGEPNVSTHDDTTVANNIIRNNNGWGLSESNNVGTRNAYPNNIVFSNGTNFATATSPLSTITADPLMIDFKPDGSGNYRLLSTSPAINAGTTSCAAATGNGNCTPSTDFSGFARPFGAALDIGPYEWHP